MKKSEGTFIEKVIDKAVGLFSAKNEARRVHFRMYARNDEYRTQFQALMSARGYKIADPSKLKTPWMGGNQTADQEVLGSLDPMTAHSRELNRDDPIASGLTNTFTMNVIGTGMRPQAQTDSDDKNERMERMFSKLKDKVSPVDDMTYGEAQRMKFKKAFEDGGVLVKQAKIAPEAPVWFETIEVDRIDTPRDATAKDPNGVITRGVEKDRNGIPVAYWIKKGKGNIAGLMGVSQNSFERVDADICTHLKFSDRPGQTHGVPRFHAIAQDLRDLDLLILASLKRIQVAACLSVFIKSENTLEDIFEETKNKYGYTMDQSLEPGMMFKLFPGEEIQTLIPNFPTTEFDAFIVMLARRIGAALGISWQIVLKDFSKANYSSARTDLLEARQTYSTMQKWFIDKCLKWEWKVILNDARLRGEPLMRNITEDDIDKIMWIPNGWHWVDPVKESTAAKIALSLGITTRQIECAKEGKDWKEVTDQLLKEEQYEMAQRKSLGLPDMPPEPSTFNLTFNDGAGSE